jgi:L-fucose isomerase-like protein
MRLKPKMGVVFTSIEGIDADQHELENYKEIVKNKLEPKYFDSHVIDFIVSNNESAQRASKILKERDIDLLFITIAVWTPDTTIIRLIDGLDVPVIIFTTTLTPYTIGLNGAQLVSATLKELDKEYRFIFGNIDDPSVFKKIYDFSMAAALAVKIKSLKIGIIGGRLPIMTNLTIDEFGLKKVFGATIVPVSFAQMQDFVESADSKRITGRVEEIKKTVKNIMVEENILSESVKYYFAFLEIVKNFGLDALSVNCYPHPYIKAKTCLALSNMNDDGITAACESDANAAILMYMLKSISGKSSLSSDLICEDTANNSIMFSHCGCGPFSCAESMDDIKLEEHFEVKSGMAVYYPLTKPGKDAVAVNLTGRENTFRLCALKGVTIPTTQTNYKGNPVTVKFNTGVIELINLIGNEGFGHHWMVAFGDYSGIFREFCKITGIYGLFKE